MLSATKRDQIVKVVLNKGFTALLVMLCFSFSITTLAQQKMNAKEAEEKRDEADKIFKKLQYTQALVIYKQVEKFYSKSAIVNFRMGVCYLKTHEKKKALAYFNSAAKMGQKDVDYIDPNYCYGRAYHFTHDFDNAIKSYKLYLSTLEAGGKDAQEISKIRHLIKMCENGKKLVAQKLTNIRIDHLDSAVNSPYPDVLPVISLRNDTLLFASRRVDLMEGKPNKETNEYSENIYISCRRGNTWIEAVALTGMNSNKDEAPLSFSWDGKKLFIYKTERNGEKNTWQFPYEDSTGKAFKMPIKSDAGNNEQGGSLSPDGKRFYFSSDQPGGKGGMDIYYMEKKSNGEWGDPVNMGSTINTEYNDISPYMFSDGKTFYFSSEGHNSMGETDIFVSKLQGNNSWSIPQNMGYPINTAEEEPSICFTADGKRAYFASIREDSYGFDDIYEVTFGVAAPVVATTAHHTNDTAKHVSHTAKIYQKGDILDEKVHFEYNSYRMPDGDKAAVDKVTELMKNHQGMKLLVNAYPPMPGRQESDPKITDKRGQAVINYLAGKGIGRDRLYLKTIESVSAKDKVKYRTVEFEVMMVNDVTAQKEVKATPAKTNLMKD